jgi:hypothetical protein
MGLHYQTFKAYRTISIWLLSCMGFSLLPPPRGFRVMLRPCRKKPALTIRLTVAQLLALPLDARAAEMSINSDRLKCV